MKACTDFMTGLCRGQHRCSCCGARIPQCVVTEVCDPCLNGDCRKCQHWVKFLQSAGTEPIVERFR